MANVHGIGDFAAPGGGGGGEYSALRGNQGALGGQYAAGGGGGWDQFGMDQGPQGAYIPIFRRRSALPDLIDLYAPWFFSRSFIFFITIVEIGMQIVAMMVGHFFFDGALSKTNQLGGPSPLTLRYMGKTKMCRAKYTPLIRDDFEYWRLVTPIFLHANIMHLAMNLFFLSQVGYTFELRWGSWQIALLFLFSGISGDMVGASGCLFGLLGADIVYMYINWDFIPKPLAQCEMCIICGLLLLNAMSGGSSNTIDNYAHFGGFVGGAVASFSLVKLLRPEEEPRKDLYRKGGLIGTLAIWISFFLALYLFPAE